MDVHLKTVKMSDLREICRRNFRVVGKDCSSRPKLYQVLERQPQHIKDKVMSEALRLAQSGIVRYASRRKGIPGSATDNLDRPAKRARAEDVSTRICRDDGDGDRMDVCKETEPDGTEYAGDYAQISMGDAHTQDPRLGKEFMETPDQETLDSLIAEFIDATGNAALKEAICCACARETPTKEIVEIQRDSIPNSRHLAPTTFHPSHTLWHGMLVCKEGVNISKNTVSVCTDCLSHLKKSEVPPLSLANDMWIGDVPYQLSNLSLAERLMIAKGFPSAYIVKLFPKQRGATNWENSQFHSGLKGNVSTYKMNPAQLAHVVINNEYPHQARILSATIGVTFVGPKGVRLSSMPDTLRVRRWRVRDALVWLKMNNPLYKDIIISEERLQELPEDGIPEEIVAVTKHSTDVAALDRERDGYVPEYDDIVEDAEEQESPEDQVPDDIENPEELLEGDTEPCTFACQALGVVDVEGDELTSTSLMSHALRNSTSHLEIGKDENFTIRRGSAFVNEYARKDPVTGERNDGGPSDPNHLLGAFPTLFPYGMGGIETKRPVDVPYEAHARWAMRYHDKRFRTDFHFPFQVFGVCQKRDICRSTVLQIRKSHFIKEMELISTIRPDDLMKASIEEGRNVRITHPAVRALRKNLAAVRTRVKGSDESRNAVRSKIWGMNLLCNPPSLWITINPSDTQDPIAQVMAGADIDLDKFCNMLGPNAAERAANVAKDPFSSARFFHFIINTVIEVLFGIKKTRMGRLHRRQGIFGVVKGYVGTVEAQGRGTLHLHMLIWLTGAPSSQNMQSLLKEPAFRDKVASYIKNVIKADINDLTTEEIVSIDPAPSVSYSRPADPRCTSKESIAKTNRTLARTLQLHTCSLRSCLKFTKGKLVCKRRAPFSTAAKEWANEAGEWGPKRTSAFMNAWSPIILSTVRANNDIKLITNGRLTAKLTFYITSYATKKQTNSSNVSALLAKDLAFHRKLERKNTDLKLINKRLIQRCANSLTKHREFSAPEVVSYIMGWKDTFESHNFATVYMDSLYSALKQQYPTLTNEKSKRSSTGETADSISTLYFSEGTACLKDQLRDYRLRGMGLSSMSLLEFLLNTYEGEILAEPSAGDKRRHDGSKASGRPRSERHEYLSTAKKGKTCRIIRTPGHETMPRICGTWFPRSDRESESEMHKAIMLSLFVPWRNLSQIKGDGESFSTSYKRMFERLDAKWLTFISNAQYYHECLDGAREKDSSSGQQVDVDLEKECRKMGLENFGLQDTPSLTEYDIDTARITRTKARDRLYTEAAIDNAIDHGIFSEDNSDRTTSAIASKASEAEADRILLWEKQLLAFNRSNAVIVAPPSADNVGLATSLAAVSSAQPLTTRIETRQGANSSCDAMDNSGSQENDRPKLSVLNSAQKRAHDIIEDRLKQHMRGKHTNSLLAVSEVRLSTGEAKQLRMLVLGPGGTGKSLLIGAITETFAYHGQQHLLAKCATTGIAAADIGGQTLHSWAVLPIARPTEDTWIDKGTRESVRRRKGNIEGKAFLIEDEVSMEDKALSYDASLAVSKIKGEEGWDSSAYEPYGGMHVIKFGDFHQFPPVKNKSGALYVDRAEDGRKAQLGREIFLQFDTVVMLEEQVRVTDEVWTDILDRIRVGQCSETDIQEIRSLVLGDARCLIPDFKEKPWSDAILVTPRHSVRELWNEYSVKKHCIVTGNRMYTVRAEDFDRSQAGELSLDARLAIAKMKDKNTGNLQDRIRIAVGMKAMVKVNYAIEADIANGTRGRIEAIVLDERDQDVVQDENGDVELRYPPALVLFRPDQPTSLIFEGIEQGLIPITPSSCNFSAVSERTKERFKITRRQLALTPGYSFTDYKSQGQTIEYVIIDIGKPPSGALSAFGIYVAMSRSRGRNNIRLLRDFDEKLFQNHPSEDLRRDMIRLQELDKETKREWDKLRRL